MSQFARPTSDVSNPGGWSFNTGTSLWENVDDVTADDLTSMIASANPPSVSPGDACTLGLGSLADPLSSTGHTLFARGSKPNTGVRIDATVELLQGATVIATLAITDIAATFSDYSYTLSGAEADAITDYTALRLRVTAWRVGTGTNRLCRFTQLYLATPDAPVVLTAGSADVGVAAQGAAIGVSAVSVTAGAATVGIAVQPATLHLSGGPQTLPAGAAAVGVTPQGASVAVGAVALSAGAAAVGVAPQAGTLQSVQYARPISDVSNPGSWVYNTGSSLAENVDDVVSDDGTTMIATPLPPPASPGSICTLQLDAIEDPQQSSGYRLVARCGKANTGVQIDGKVELLDRAGTTVLATLNITAMVEDGTFPAYTYDLTPTEIDAISTHDHGGLQVRLSAWAVGGGTARQGRFTQVYLQTPSPLARTPLVDLGVGTYMGYDGGLYPGGSNALPSTHAAAGVAAAAAVQPLDTSGSPSPTGKIVLLSCGFSNASQEWSDVQALPSTPSGTPNPWTLMGQAAADGEVDTSALVILNGAIGGQTNAFWDDAADTDYDWVETNVLTPAGVTPEQVQAIWLKMANVSPTNALPDASADCINQVTQGGNILRALKTRYPNLQLVFLSSRIYAGYAHGSAQNPEPFAYEGGLAVKWLVQAQIDQMDNAGVVQDARAGDLDYSTGAAPWIAWGPYLWADGVNPRGTDGLTYLLSDYESDLTHPDTGAETKVADQLLAFFKTDPRAATWFLAAQALAAGAAAVAVSAQAAGSAPGPLTLSAGAAQVGVGAQPAILAATPIALTAGAAAVAVSAQPATLSLGGAGPQTLVAGTAQIGVAVQTATVGTTLTSLNAGRATVAVAAQPGAAGLGAISLAAGSASVAVAVQPAALGNGAQTLPAGAAIVSVSAQGGSLSVGAVSPVASAAVITLAVQAGVVVPAAISIQAGAAVVTVLSAGATLVPLGASWVTWDFALHSAVQGGTSILAPVEGKSRVRPAVKGHFRTT